jgi:hypothetical protein
MSNKSSQKPMSKADQIKTLEKGLQQLRLRIAEMAQGCQRLAQLQALNQPLLDRLVRVAIYYEVGHDCPSEQVLESYPQEAVEAYIKRAGEAFVKRMQLRSKQTGTVASDHGNGWSTVSGSEDAGAAKRNDVDDGESKESAHIGGISTI